MSELTKKQKAILSNCVNDYDRVEYLASCENTIDLIIPSLEYFSDKKSVLALLSEFYFLSDATVILKTLKIVGNLIRHSLLLEDKSFCIFQIILKVQECTPQDNNPNKEVIKTAIIAFYEEATRDLNHKKILNLFLTANEFHATLLTVAVWHPQAVPYYLWEQKYQKHHSWKPREIMYMLKRSKYNSDAITAALRALGEKPIEGDMEDSLRKLLPFFNLFGREHDTECADFLCMIGCRVSIIDVLFIFNDPVANFFPLFVRLAKVVDDHELSGIAEKMFEYLKFKDDETTILDILSVYSRKIRYITNDREVNVFSFAMECMRTEGNINRVFALTQNQQNRPNLFTLREECIAKFRKEFSRMKQE